MTERKFCLYACWVFATLLRLYEQNWEPFIAAGFVIIALKED